MGRKPPEDADETHEALWMAIQSLLGCFKWAGPIVLTLLGTILSYAYSIEKSLSEALKHTASLTSEQKSTDRDLQDKYSRHIGIHEDLKQRLSRIEGAIRDAHYLDIYRHKDEE